jgi:hypothetical protein
MTAYQQHAQRENWNIEIEVLYMRLTSLARTEPARRALGNGIFGRINRNLGNLGLSLYRSYILYRLVVAFPFDRKDYISILIGHIWVCAIHPSATRQIEPRSSATVGQGS